MCLPACERKKPTALMRLQHWVQISRPRIELGSNMTAHDCVNKQNHAYECDKLTALILVQHMVQRTQPRKIKFEHSRAQRHRLKQRKALTKVRLPQGRL